MGRELTQREHSIATFLIDNGDPLPGDPALGSDERAGLRGRLATAHAGEACSCGTCPSIQLIDDAAPSADGELRTVLSADIPGATLLLFIDRGQLSYLELAPHADKPFAKFPVLASSPPALGPTS